jgi:hypothetical protein
MNHHSSTIDRRQDAYVDAGTDVAAERRPHRRLTRNTLIAVGLAFALAASTLTVAPAHAEGPARQSEAPAAESDTPAVDAASVEALLRDVGVVSDQPSAGAESLGAGSPSVDSASPNATTPDTAFLGTVSSDTAESTATLSVKSGLSVRTGAKQVRVRPIAMGVATASPGGLSVYANGAESAFALSTARTGGNAGYSVITGAGAPSDYAYTITVNGAPAVLNLTAEGGVDVLDAGGAVANSIAPAWATDATGASVATSYSVTGNILTQRVQHAGAAYPVVADPRFRCDGLWCTVELSRYETRLMAAGALSPGIACRFLGPGAGICAALLIAGWAQANIALNTGQCIGVRVWQRNLVSYLHLAYVRCYA